MTTSSADQLYDRRWAANLLESARSKLRDEYAVAGRANRQGAQSLVQSLGQPRIHSLRSRAAQDFQNLRRRAEQVSDTMALKIFYLPGVNIIRR